MTILHGYFCFYSPLKEAWLLRMNKFNFQSWVFIVLVSFTLFCKNESSTQSNDDNGPPPKVYPTVMLEADNPKIEGIVSKVSRDSLESYIQSLVGFFTRHTNSDTTSSTRGIGAARRWVFDKFSDISDRNGGRLQVYYHNFQATVRGVTGLHRNVIAELPGTSTSDGKFIVGGHLDSRGRNNDDAVGFAPGANDDGSGVAAVIELARLLSELQFESTLIFAAFTGEDQGLFGSRAYAQDLKSSDANIVGMVTNDVVGNIVGGGGNIDSVSVRCFSDQQSDEETSPNRQLARYIKLQGEAYLPNFIVNLIPSRDRPGRGGDHFSFNEQGYTAARLTEPEDNLDHQHNMDDLPQFMSFPYLTKVVKINAGSLASWADAPEPVSNVRLSSPVQGISTLNWDQSNSNDFSAYLVAFRNPASVAYDSLKSLDDKNEFVFKLSDFPNGVFLSISAVDTDGNESVFSQEVFVE